jgi:hypothetical protein
VFTNMFSITLHFYPICFDKCYPPFTYINITNIPCFIGLYKFCAKFDFHRFIQKSHEFHVMLNMNDVYMYLVSWIFKLMRHCFWMTYVIIHV